MTLWAQLRTDLGTLVEAQNAEQERDDNDPTTHVVITGILEALTRVTTLTEQDVQIAANRLRQQDQQLQAQAIQIQELYLRAGPPGIRPGPVARSVLDSRAIGNLPPI